MCPAVCVFLSVWRGKLISLEFFLFPASWKISIYIDTTYATDAEFSFQFNK